MAVVSGKKGLPEPVRFQLQQFKHLVSQLDKALQATTAAAAAAGGPPDLAAAVPDPLERARLCVALAKAVNSLHHVYLRAHGRDPLDEPAAGSASSSARQEMERIRQYGKKVSRAVQEAETRSARPSLRMDVAAASRFIDAALPDLTAQQREALKRGAQVIQDGKSKGWAVGTRAAAQRSGGLRNVGYEEKERERR
ncbi:Nuclear nucleic acid-binding protein C1D [Tetrabaena socialis]|uniref:Nuclear nucleic acid-binding protein C1D n=1 Tax=Tetrabaena socialis TaxID=47790 RepID=A0A2J8A7Y2_9CHLO|nr:Nuclear nucleic acid-binding protein C1D [Tetrabaena socialis]|eukprot:PNH08583.1 Nuclear nucleic acid-binding protein C1D [Tetrabaena socialis]